MLIKMLIMLYKIYKKKYCLKNIIKKRLKQISNLNHILS